MVVSLSSCLLLLGWQNFYLLRITLETISLNPYKLVFALPFRGNLQVHGDSSMTPHTILVQQLPFARRWIFR
jgi:hypothetical protein